MLRVFERIVALVDLMYIVEHISDEMRVMWLQILGLLHGKHFLIYAENQMVELGLVALFSRVEFEQPLSQDHDDGLEVVVVSFLLLSGGEPTVNTHS